MIQKEDLVGKSQKELQDLLTKDLEQYAVEIETLDENEIVLREQDLMKLMDENDNYLKNVRYTLPKECLFDNQSFTRKTIYDSIIDFINTQELEWSYSLGMYELVKLWKNKNMEEISYHAYDSTLRVLGQCKYRGYDAWRKILAINEYMSSCHDEYVRDTSYMIYLTQLHNSLLDALKKFNPEQLDQAPTADEPIE